MPTLPYATGMMEPALFPILKNDQPLVFPGVRGLHFVWTNYCIVRDSVPGIQHFHLHQPPIATGIQQQAINTPGYFAMQFHCPGVLSRLHSIIEQAAGYTNH